MSVAAWLLDLEPSAAALPSVRSLATAAVIRPSQRHSDLLLPASVCSDQLLHLVRLCHCGAHAAKRGRGNPHLHHHHRKPGCGCSAWHEIGCRRLDSRALCCTPRSLPTERSRLSPQCEPFLPQVSSVFVMFSVVDAVIYENTLELVAAIVLGALCACPAVWTAPISRPASRDAAACRLLHMLPERWQAACGATPAVSGAVLPCPCVTCCPSCCRHACAGAHDLVCLAGEAQAAALYCRPHCLLCTTCCACWPEQPVLLARGSPAAPLAVHQELAGWWCELTCIACVLGKRRAAPTHHSSGPGSQSCVPSKCCSW